MVEALDQTIVAAEPEDAERVIAVLTRAFATDPPNRWLFPEMERYQRWFPEFARALGGAALSQRTALMTRDGSAVALWLAPGTGPDEPALEKLIAEGVAAENQEAMAAVVEQMVHYHPHEPHWYLPFIGVEPVRQGQGLGTALLRVQLATCDKVRLPAYLESTNPRNRLLYERHGFEALAEIKVASCPPVVPMLRRPR
jgi:ribosomal protein S18 acetylase RimI-like enzyme